MIPRKHRLPLCFFVRLFGPSEPSEVTPALIFQSPIDLRSLSPYCLRRLPTRPGCSWWGVSLSAVIAEPGTARFSEADMSLGWHILQMARTGILRREFVFLEGCSIVKVHWCRTWRWLSWQLVNEFTFFAHCGL